MLPEDAESGRDERLGENTGQTAIDLAPAHLGLGASARPPFPPAAGRRLFFAAPGGIDNRHVGLGNRHLGRCKSVGIGFSRFDRADKLDKVIAIREDIEAYLLDPVGGGRAEHPLQVAILRFHDLDRAGGTVVGHVAEYEEMFAGHDLGLQLGIGLLPPFAAHGFGLLIALCRRQLGRLVSNELIGSSRIRLYGLLGVHARVELCSLFDPLFDRGNRLIRHAILSPLGHPRALRRL